jgi:hypothetical protein
MDRENAPDSVYTLSAATGDASRLACQHCGTAFARRPRGRNGRFCSARCRGKHHAARKAAALNALESVIATAMRLIRELRETQ